MISLSLSSRSFLLIRFARNTPFHFHPLETSSYSRCCSRQIKTLPFLLSTLSFLAIERVHEDKRFPGKEEEEGGRRRRRRLRGGMAVVVCGCRPRAYARTCSLDSSLSRNSVPLITERQVARARARALQGTQWVSLCARRANSGQPLAIARIPPSSSYRCARGSRICFSLYRENCIVLFNLKLEGKNF